MSKAVSARGNLITASKLRELGFANLFEMQPQMRDRFHQLWYEGTNISESRRILSREFPDGQVPSGDSCMRYVKHHLKDKPISTHTTQYMDLVNKVNSIGTIYDGVEHLKQLALKSRQGNAKLETQRRIYDTLITKAVMLAELEGKLGIRQMVMPTQVTVNNNTLNVGENIEKNNERLASIDRLLELKRILTADREAGRVLEGENVSQSSGEYNEREPNSI